MRASRGDRSNRRNDHHQVMRTFTYSELRVLYAMLQKESHEYEMNSDEFIVAVKAMAVFKGMMYGG